MKTDVILADPDEVLRCVTDSRDRRAFERAGRKALGVTGPLREVINTIPEMYVAWVTWHALTRDGQDTGGFDAFEARLVEIRGEEDEEDEGALPDPTRRGRSGG